MQLTLTKKIIILLISIVVTTLAVFNFFLKDYYTKDEMEHIEKLINQISSLRSATYTRLLQKNDVTAIEEEIKSDIQLIKDFSDVRIYDENGVLISGYNKKASYADDWVAKAILSKSPRQKWDGYKLMSFEPLIHAYRHIFMLN
jgi:sensor histidine kinase regulating citrate/malate metabolism